MAKFHDLSVEEKMAIASNAIDWAMNGYVDIRSPLSNMEQYVEQELDDFYEDKDELIDFLEKEAARPLSV